MKAQMLFILLLQFAIPRPMSAAEAKPVEPQRIRIGVDIRLSYQSCIDYWTPITDHLSRAMPAYRFVVVPLASHQDMVHLLETNGIDFMSLDPAMELMAEDRFGVAPLATIVESPHGVTMPSPSDATCSGAIIRRADRINVKTINDIRGQRVAAVKPWSLTGWIAQWGLLVKQGINPQNGLKQVTFLGTNGDVIKNVLDGTVDVGVVDADMLFYFGKNQRIPNGSLCVFNQQGHAAPLLSGEFAASTIAYPGRLIAKAKATPDELAKRVVEVLMNTTQRTTLDGMPLDIRWTVPCNYSEVRQLLQSLMGPQFADSAGYPLLWKYPAWSFPATVAFGAAVVLAIVISLLRRHYGRQENLLNEQLATVGRELMEIRAEKQRLDAILSLAGCGIDIVDDDDQVVYADSGIERRYGEWRGKKCYEYFCGAGAPCSGCHRPGPLDDPTPTVTDFDCSQWAMTDDPHAKPHCDEGEATRMIGIPFRDEGGRWLYARIHLPLAAFSEINTKATSP